MDRATYQLAEDMLDDAKAIAGLCRLCIQRCLEDDPIDTLALGGLYRQLLVSASSRVRLKACPGVGPPSRWVIESISQRIPPRLERAHVLVGTSMACFHTGWTRVL